MKRIRYVLLAVLALAAQACAQTGGEREPDGYPQPPGEQEPDIYSQLRAVANADTPEAFRQAAAPLIDPSEIRAALGRDETVWFHLELLERALSVGDAHIAEQILEREVWQAFRLTRNDVNYSVSVNQIARAEALIEEYELADPRADDDEDFRTSVFAMLEPSRAPSGAGVADPAPSSSSADGFKNTSGPAAAPVFGSARGAADLIPVFYGANRAFEMVDGRRRHTNERGDLTYGVMQISVPRERERGDIPRPVFFGENPARHFIIESLTPFEGEGFDGQLAGLLNAQADAGSDVFIFIHGHATTFDQAAYQTAMLAADLDMRSGAIMYSWPNGESPMSYQISQQNVPVSSRHLVDFLDSVLAETGARRVHIIAHSMGNRVLMRALERMALTRSGEAAPFAQVIWASPDVDADYFAQAGRDVLGLAEGMTVYTSAKDRALQLSQNLAGSYPRAGQAEPLPEIAELMAAIDTTSISDGALGHFDFMSTAMSDMRAVLWLDLPVQARCALEPVALESGPTYWRNRDRREREGVCTNEAVEWALRLARRVGRDGSLAQAEALFDGDDTSMSWEQVSVLLERWGYRP